MKSQKSSGAQAAKSDEAISTRPAALLTTAALIAALSFAAFLPALGNQFVNWDDYETLLNNLHYRGLAWPQIGWMFTTFYMGHYQPLSWLSFAADYLIWGTNPLGYHLTNLFLHAVNSVLVFFLARRLIACAIPAREPGVDFGVVLGAALAALLFSLHPLRVESVVWATERRDVLSGNFYFLTILAYPSAQAAGRNRARRLVLSLVFYALSLLAKGTAMTLPAVLLLLDVYPLRRLPGTLSTWVKSEYRRIFWEKLPYLALATIFALLAILAQRESGALRPVQQYFFSYRIGQAFYGLCFYLWKTMMPVGLSPLYELPYDFDAWMPYFYICGATVLAISFALYCFRRRWPSVLAAWIYYIVLLVPVTGFAQSGPQLVADRYSYLSCVSWALLVAGAWSRFWISSWAGAGRLKLGGATAVVVLIVLGAMSWQQSEVWRDTTTLWRHVIAVAPESSIAYYNLGRGYEDAGKISESLQYYRRAVEINPANPDAQYNLARLLAKQGRFGEAIAAYQRALKVRPDDADAHNNLGLLLVRRGESDAAAAEFHTAVKIDPRYAKAFFNLGRLSADRGEGEKAIEYYRQALRLNPNQADILLGLAETLAALGRLNEAAENLQKAVSLKPNSPEAHTALARVLAAQGHKEAAERHYREALRLLQEMKPSS